KNQRDRFAADEIRADDEGFRQTIGLRLHRIGEANAPLRAVLQERAKERLLGGRRDHQDLANAREHQRRQRVINHRLVIDRQKLLADRLRERIKTRSTAAGENDPLHLRDPQTSTGVATAARISFRTASSPSRQSVASIPKSRSILRQSSTE